MTIRQFSEPDHEGVCALAAAVFEAMSIDAAVERGFGELGGTSWRDRKRRDISNDLAGNPAGCFVAEVAGQLVGFITTAVDREASVGRIPNLGVAEGMQGQGIGKALVSRALDYFGAEGAAVHTDRDHDDQ